MTHRLAIFLACITFSSAEDIYVAQSTSGADTGADCSNAHSVAWLNTSGNWGVGAGKVSSGDIVHLCGTITTAPVVRGSGSVGNPITIYFEPSAKVSIAASTTMQCQSQSYIVIDGGVNGILENTDNGSSLGNQVATSGVYASGSSNLEIKNLTVQNLYVHSLATDNINTLDTQGALYMNGFGDNISVHNCLFSNICWVLNFQSGSGIGMNIYSNAFLNYDHGVAGLGNSYSTVNIYNNHFGTTANWDTSGNVWHHDGIHFFFGAGATLSGVNVYNNLFDGDWGINNTAYLYFEGDYTHTNPNAISGMTIYNNAFLEFAGNLLNNGMALGGGTAWSWLNNTFAGSGVSNSLGLKTHDGTNTVVENNIFSGLTTFISNGTNVVLNNNLYAAQVPAGNSPWVRESVSYNTFSAWVAASGEANSISTSVAGLNSDGTPQGMSPALRTGVDLSSVFTTDKAGVTRSVPWDMGAYAYTQYPFIRVVSP